MLPTRGRQQPRASRVSGELATPTAPIRTETPGCPVPGVVCAEHTAGHERRRNAHGVLAFELRRTFVVIESLRNEARTDFTIEHREPELLRAHTARVEITSDVLRTMAHRASG